ncbi:hypothetical protein EUGRSUZ_J02964 [Eucalyptus grandis]|uniref:Uncharacterized protein n=2 Tax=Eucalyptus grandis TaxID=71139 RepID=A0ACC3JAK8_EUCGR|nr:hypothetical protein EUGRSUZ_J02964 [Eucalyptus grandis]
MKNDHGSITFQPKIAATHYSYKITRKIPPALSSLWFQSCTLPNQQRLLLEYLKLYYSNPQHRHDEI